MADRDRAPSTLIFSGRCELVAAIEHLHSEGFRSIPRDRYRRLKPWRLEQARHREHRPMPISSGSQPAATKPRKMPSGFKPRFDASLSLMITEALAPSDNWLALPAVMVNPSRAPAGDWPGLRLTCPAAGLRPSTA